MKGRVYREIYMLYFFCLFLEKVIKKLLTFCYWKDSEKYFDIVWGQTCPI